MKRLALVFLFALAACSGGSGPETPAQGPGTVGDPGFDESKPMLQPDGPLGGVVLASEIADDGSASEPRLAFTTDDTQVTAVVALGMDVPEASILTVTWYRLTGVDGRETLFSHEIDVGPGGHAFSEGLAEGGLAPGIYETVATLDGHQVRTPWIGRVEEASESGRARGSADASAVAQTVSDEDWNVPDSGDSGWEWGPPPPPDAPPSDECTVVSLNGGLEPLTQVDASAIALGPCTELTLSATVDGPPVTIGALDPTAMYPTVYGAVDICALPGGSDMPGTVVRFAVSGSASAEIDYTLPDLGEVLVAGMESVPAPGSRVDEGDRIRLHALAMVMLPALGIRVLYVDDGATLIESVGNASGSDEPIACDLGRIVASLVGEYVVPEDPPPVIRLCAYAEGFDGTRADDCLVFYTGEVWTGSYSGEVTWDCGPLGAGITTLEATFTIVVGADRVATLEAEHTATGSCEGPDSGQETTPITATGTRTPSGFEFPSYFGGGGTIVITTSGDTGTGTFTEEIQTGVVNLTLEVRCLECSGAA